MAQIAELAWGYTMADIDSMSFKAARRSRGGWTLDFKDKQETAWGAIVEMLYTSTDQPAYFTLLTCGTDAVDREARHVNRSHGVREGRPGDDEKPRFLQYWLPVIGPMSDFTDKICEREALPQILSKLTPSEYETIVTLAAYGTQKAAAEALGLKLPTYSARLWNARMRLWRFWFEGETPPPKTRSSATTCRYGHLRSEYGFINNHGSQSCRRCSRNRTNKHYGKKRDDRLKLDLDD
ncbi:hypothetical protein [Nocardioides aquaticus]|uniref:hypothetical protein n=1 Tax=Nocardioides aquaticus TaxID=160826 RepID=UPI001BD52C98|nr:hypothetical protein [Nocardioides aquaticus]